MQKVPKFIILSEETTTSLRQGFCDQGVSWSSSLMNWRTLQPTSSSNCWCQSHTWICALLISHVLELVHWTGRLPLQYKSNWILGQGFNCKLVFRDRPKGLVRFLILKLLVIDNSEFLGVVILKSPNGVLSRWFSPFVNKLPVSNLFSITFR